MFLLKKDISDERLEPFRRIVNDQILKDFSQYSDPLDLMLEASSCHILTRFFGDCPKNYNPKAFYGKMPEAWEPFVHKEPSMLFNAQLYHNKRRKYLEALVDEIEKEPKILRKYESFLANFFLDNLLEKYEQNLTETDAWTANAQIEANLADMYKILCVRKFGHDRYISGISKSGNIYSKQMKKMDKFELAHFYNEVHSHGVVFLSMDSKVMDELIPDNARWASLGERLTPFLNETRGMVGYEMLHIALEKKEYYSPIPHEFMINNKTIKSITIKDVPPHHVYFLTTYLDGSISTGAMGANEDRTSDIGITSDIYSHLIMQNFLSTRHPGILFDLAGSMARDMMVSTERYPLKDHYTIQREGAKNPKYKDKFKERVRLLPRTFKVDLNGHSSDAKYVTEQIVKLGASHVPGHKRLCTNPSPQALARAKIFIPEGYTYVQDYSRGESKEFKRTFRSKSAMRALYGSE